jgi:hypothetical protein
VSIVSEARIRVELAAIAAHAKAVRTYSSTQGLERVLEIAAELGLTVTLGIWIDKDNARNEREISTALELDHRYPNVTRLVVGNETMFRHEQTAASLAKLINRVKQNSPVPVATADRWKFFLDNPELVDAVDQVFAHILPYGGDMPKESAVDDSIEMYDRLLKAYPAKKIVIGEFGWPSEGYNFERAVASLAHFTSSYRFRVVVPYWQMFGAMFMFMSVQWTVASAALKAALPARQSYFHRTRKGNGAMLRAPFIAKPEALLGALLVVGSITIYATNVYRYIESDLFATVLLIQSLPFLAAVALAWLERLSNRKSAKESYFQQAHVGEALVACKEAAPTIRGDHQG